MRNLSSFSSSEGAYERLLGSKALKAVLAACAISAYSNTANAEITDAPFGTFPYTDHVNVIKTSPTESYVGMAQYNGVSDWDIYVTNCVNDVCTPEELIDDSACDSDKKITTGGDQTSVAFCPPGSACDGYGFVATGELFQFARVMKFSWNHSTQEASQCEYLPAPLDGSTSSIDRISIIGDGSMMIMTDYDGVYTSPTYSPYEKIAVQGLTTSHHDGAVIWGSHLLVGAEYGCNQVGAYDVCACSISQYPSPTQPMIVTSIQNANLLFSPDVVNNADSQGVPSVDNYGKKMTYGSGGYLKQVDLPGTGGSAGAAGAGGSGGSAGMGGMAGSAGEGGSGGASGSAGSAGMGGMAGSAGEGGTGGMAGSAGEAGTGGAAGSEQDGGVDAGLEWENCGVVQVAIVEGSGDSCSFYCEGDMIPVMPQSFDDCTYAVSTDDYSNYSLIHTSGNGESSLSEDGLVFGPDYDVATSIEDLEGGPKISVELPLAKGGSLLLGAFGTKYVPKIFEADDANNPYGERFVRLSVTEGEVRPSVNGVPIEIVDSEGNVHSSVKAGDPAVDISLTDGRFIGAPIVPQTDGGTNIAPSAESNDGGGCAVCSTPGAVNADTRDALIALGGFLGLAFAASRRRKED